MLFLGESLPFGVEFGTLPGVELKNILFLTSFWRNFMTNLLLRLFVRDYENTGEAAVRSAIGRLSGGVGIGCNLLLVLIKLLAGTLSGSVSITADALNNLSDASGSILTLVGFRMADKPADQHHPYGHARAEYLSGLGVAVLILFIGFELVKSSLEKIFHPAAVALTPLVAALLLVSIAVKLWMALFNRSLGNRIGSTALLAAAADSRNDCIATAAVLGASLAERLLDIRVDGFVGLPSCWPPSSSIPWTSASTDTSAWAWPRSSSTAAGIWQRTPSPPCWEKTRTRSCGRRSSAISASTPRSWATMTSWFMTTVRASALPAFMWKWTTGKTRWTAMSSLTIWSASASGNTTSIW